MGASLLQGTGDGTLESPVRYATAGGGAIAAGDLNGDGRPDLAVANSGSDLLTILLNTGQTAASFKLAVIPSAQTLNAGDSSTFTVTATTGNGFNGAVALTCGGQPTGSTCTVNPASIIPTANGAAATVTVTTIASTPAGAYTPTINGKSGNEPFTVKASLTVQTSPDFALKAFPTSITMLSTETASFAIIGTALNFFPC